MPPLPARNMKTLLTLPFFLALGACVAPPQAEKAACCEDDAPMAAATPLVEESLYQFDVTWTDQTAQARTLADFRGEVVVTAMVFTHCQYACPMILSDLKKIEDSLAPEVREDVRWLLVSMDSDRDLPPVLATYADTNHLDTKRWTLLHGDDYAVRTFAAALGVNYVKDSKGNFSHSSIINVLDREGQLIYQLDGLKADATPCVAAIQQAVAQP